MSVIKSLFQTIGLMGILSACQFNQSENPSQTNSPKTDSQTNPAIEEFATSSNPVFESVLPELAKKTNIDPVLPTYLPEYQSDPPLHANLINADGSKYQIVLGYTPDCTGQNVCRLGNIEAEKENPSSPLKGEQTVTLNNGTEAYFTDAVCDAQCSDSTLTWKQDSVTHSVGIKAGKMETLIKIANSM